MTRPALLATAVLLIFAGPASAGSVTIGSDLSAPATVFQAEPVDSVYWNTALASGGKVTSPVKGEVSIVKLKGRINRTGAKKPEVVLHIQVLRPVAGGKVRVMVTSGNLKLPFGGKANRISTFNLQSMPARICVRPGDFVAMSTSGGFGPGYDHGAQFQMFGAVPGSAFRSLTGAGKDMDGDMFKGTNHADQELLVQSQIATGKAARPTCR